MEAAVTSNGNIVVCPGAKVISELDILTPAVDEFTCTNFTKDAAVFNTGTAKKGLANCL
jgi:hypothetical protein